MPEPDPTRNPGAQDDPVPGANPDGPIRQGHPHTGDFSILGDESFGPGVGVRGHPGVQQSLEEPRGQRGARNAQVAGTFVDRRVQARPGLGVETDVRPVGRERRDPGCPFAQLSQVEGAALSDLPPVGCPRQLGTIVGKAGGDLELEAAVGLDEIEHRRAGPHERFDQLVVHRPE